MLNGQILCVFNGKCGWSTEQVKQYRDTRGFALKDSNHIGKVNVHKILNTNFMYVKAECDRQTSLSENLILSGC